MKAISVPESEEKVAAEGKAATLLVAADGSESALHAGERAVMLARGLRAKLYVLNVVDPHELFYAEIHRQHVERKAARRGNEVTGGGDVARRRAMVGSVSEEVLRLVERPVILFAGRGRPRDDPVRRKVEEEAGRSAAIERPPD